jgi:hypothetical protein
METRSLNTIKNNTTILSSFCFDDQHFDVRNLSFRKNSPLFIITSRNIKDNTINRTKIAPVAELAYTATKRLRFTCKPSVNYPELKKVEAIILSTIEKSITCSYVTH